MRDSTFLRRVMLKNYKSIAACDVQPGPLTFLVGPNGAGKSNFLDALRFVADALRTSLDHALRDRDGTGPYVPLVGIEEPELALHPAAAGVLIDCLREASRTTQVLVTSHSPDLLDNPQLDTDAILAVVGDAGATAIGRLDEAGKSALRDRLFTAGELLRLNQLAPDPTIRDLSGRQLRLFDKGDA